MSNHANKKRTLLVKDADVVFATALAFCLELEGYQVLKTTSSLSAWEKFKETSIDAVIMDFRKSEIEDQQFLEKLRKKNPRPGILLLYSAYLDMDLKNFDQRGIEGLFSKPVDSTHLVEMLNRFFNSSKKDFYVHREPRKKIELEVSLRFEENTKSFDTKLTNLSRGGMFVLFDGSYLPKVGETVDFKIKAKKEGSLVEGSGIVRWERLNSIPGSPAGCGIEFTYLPEKHRDLINEILHSEKVL